MRDRWARLPPGGRWVLAACLAGFADGTGAHVRWMMHGGIHAYAAFGYAPVQVFMVALIALDPLAFVLMALVRREGVWLAVAVMALDVPANWAGNWPAMPRFMISAWPDEAFAVFVFAAAVPLLRAARNSPSGWPAARPGMTRGDAGDVPRGAGRPPAREPPSGITTDTIVCMAMTLRLADDETEALRRRAELEHRSMQEVARQAIREYVENHSRAELLDQVLDEELPRYAEALERLGQ